MCQYHPHCWQQEGKNTEGTCSDCGAYPPGWKRTFSSSHSLPSCDLLCPVGLSASSWGPQLHRGRKEQQHSSPTSQLCRSSFESFSFPWHGSQAGGWAVGQEKQTSQAHLNPWGPENSPNTDTWITLLQAVAQLLSQMCNGRRYFPTPGMGHSLPTGSVLVHDYGQQRLGY